MNEERQQIVRAALEKELRRLSGDIQAVELVDDIPILEAFFDDYASALVANARSAGASWADIAGRLGVSRQAVHKRFASKSKGRRAVIELRIRRDKG